MEALSRLKQREVAYHNERYRADGSDNRARLDRWYDAVESGAQRQLELIERYGRGRQVLEYGCADGRFALVEHAVAQQAAHYWGIDISDSAIARATALGGALDLTNCTFNTMDAEDVRFASGQFDLVFGRGIVHHLDLDRAFAEIRRVLRDDGVAVFYEPMGHNPVLNSYRQRTPQLRTVGEHPLVTADFDLARRYFGSVDVRYFGLTTLGPAALPQSRFRDHALRAFEHVDDWLLRVPLINRNAWFVLLTLRPTG